MAPTRKKKRNASNGIENDFNSINVNSDVDQELRIDLRNESSETKTLEPQKTRRKAKTKDVSESMPQEDEGYVPKWASSLNQAPVLEDDADSTVNDNDSYSDLASVDDLPPFSDEESKGLHREIKLLEQRGEDAAKAARSHRERITVINDHLHSIRQEIDHTNSLVAAKKGEVETEEHISSLLKRELGQFTRDASGVDDLISVKQKQIARCKSQLVSVGDELEKLKTDLNWNQEELEQWATAATKKEEENLILQKYASADELKIKELALTIEDLTKVSVEKKSLLENEVTETRSNQTELEKLAERFKSRHDERRQLIQQWKDTIESMNNRDQAIGVLASQYSDLVKQEDEIKDVLVENKNDHEMLENEREDYQQEISQKERHLQARRQDLSSLQESEVSLRTETESLQREHSNAAASIDNKRTGRKVALAALDQKKDHAESLSKILDAAKDKLSQDKLDTRSAEKITETMEKAFVEREKELQASEKNIASLKQKMYRDSLKLAEFRKKEAELISDIHGIHANIKNFSSKVGELESKRSRQEELLYNANFQLQQMEKKVSRGLGERSNEEQQKLMAKIDELEKEVASEKQEKALLVQQHRKLQAELRAWNKKNELTDAKYNETKRKIDGIDLEIYSSEQSLKDTVSKREEAMVSHDITLLDVRRLRDALRSLLEDIIALKQQASQVQSSMREKRDEALGRVEINMGQLRTRKEECHKTAIDVGRLKMALEKVELKYNTIMSINNADKESDDYQSPELKLILAAQKRQELQEEGDKLDETIRKKEMEIRTMKKTLVQLRERNTNFRSSFAKADMNGAKAQELIILEADAEESEEALFRVRKELQVLQKCATEDRVKLERLTRELSKRDAQNQEMLCIKEKFKRESQEYNATLDAYNSKVSALQESCSQNRTGQALQLKKFRAELVDIQSDRICKLLVSLGQDFTDLCEDIMVDMKKEGLLE